MNFKHLTTFRSAAHTLNFSEAAISLNIVQSAVTAHIRALETELKVKLFDRSGRGVQLTSAGKQLLHYAEQLFSLHEEAVHNLQQNQDINGEITIAGYESVLTYRLPQVLKAFIQQHPEVRVNVVSLNVNQLHHQVSNQHIDIAFSLDSEVKTDNLSHHSLKQEPVVLIAHPEHPLAQQKNVSSAELQKETLLLTEPGCSYRTLLEQRLTSTNAPRGARMEFISIEAIKACVKLGMGVAAISQTAVAEELKNGELTTIHWAETTITMNMSMVWNDQR